MGLRELILIPVLSYFEFGSHEAMKANLSHLRD